MARSKEFCVKPRTRKYQPRAGGEIQVRKVFKACWIGPDGLPDSTERKDWTQKEALEFARQEWLKVHGGTFVKKCSATMADAIELWLKDLEERRKLWFVLRRKTKQTISGAYYKQMLYLAETVLVPMFGPLHPSKIDKPFIERWARQVVLDGEMTPYQVHYAFKRISILLDIAHGQGWIPLNPFRKAKPVLPEVEPTNVIVPEDDDIVAMLRVIEADACPLGESEVLFSSMRMAIFLVAYAGLRPSEASALHWEDIDLDRMEIHNQRGFTYEEGHKESGKTRAADRLIDILPQLHHELNEYRRRTIEITPMSGRLVTWQALAERNANPTGLVLCNAYIGTLSPESIGIHWRKLRKRVKERDLTKITLYSLRHYAGSIWLRDGMSLPRVSAMMGHTDIRTTEQIYIKVLRELDEDRLRDMRQIGQGIDRRYRALGLTLGSTPVPVLNPPPDPIVVQAPASLEQSPLIEAQVDGPPLPAVAAMGPLNFAKIRAATNQEVLALFDAGRKVPVIARKLGISIGTVRNIIDDRDTAFSGRRTKWDLTPEERAQRDAEARRLAEEEGLSYREIAPLVGMGVAALRQTAYRQGWRAARKRVTYNAEYKTNEDSRARAREAQRRHRARQQLIEAGLEVPAELQVQSQVGIPKPASGPRARLTEEERRAHRKAWQQSEAGRASKERYRKSEKNREAQHRYKTSEKGRAKGREDRKKYWARKRAEAKTVEVTCECGRTFERPYKPGKPRTKCEVCSPPQPDRIARRRAHRDEQRRVRAERAAAKAAVASEQVVTKPSLMDVTH